MRPGAVATSTAVRCAARCAAQRAEQRRLPPGRRAQVCSQRSCPTPSIAPRPAPERPTATNLVPGREPARCGWSGAARSPALRRPYMYPKISYPQSRGKAGCGGGGGVPRPSRPLLAFLPSLVGQLHRVRTRPGRAHRCTPPLFSSATRLCLHPVAAERLANRPHSLWMVAGSAPGTRRESVLSPVGDSAPRPVVTTGLRSSAWCVMMWCCINVFGEAGGGRARRRALIVSTVTRRRRAPVPSCRAAGTSPSRRRPGPADRSARPPGRPRLPMISSRVPGGPQRAVRSARLAKRRPGRRSPSSRICGSTSWLRRRLGARATAS